MENRHIRSRCADFVYIDIWNHDNTVTKSARSGYVQTQISDTD